MSLFPRLEGFATDSPNKSASSVAQMKNPSETAQESTGGAIEQRMSVPVALQHCAMTDS